MKYIGSMANLDQTACLFLQPSPEKYLIHHHTLRWRREQGGCCQPMPRPVVIQYHSQTARQPTVAFSTRTDRTSGRFLCMHTVATVLFYLYNLDRNVLSFIFSIFLNYLHSFTAYYSTTFQSLSFRYMILPLSIENLIVFIMLSPHASS